VINRLKKF